MSKRTCPACRGPLEQYHNYCSWDCGVALARADGAVEHLPNGLPIRCITASGLLLECEHGDHPTYLFPVTVEGRDHPEDVAMGCESYPETHALIYTDGCVALTLNECCYYLWGVSDGEPLGGELQRKHERLSEESRRKIAERAVCPREMGP